jgi:hypothetical protein
VSEPPSSPNDNDHQPCALGHARDASASSELRSAPSASASEAKRIFPVGGGDRSFPVALRSVKGRMALVGAERLGARHGLAGKDRRLPGPPFGVF